MSANPENIYWSSIMRLDRKYDYLEVSQTSKSRWSVTIDGHDYSVRTNSTDFWTILAAAFKLREKRLLKLASRSAAEDTTQLSEGLG